MSDSPDNVTLRPARKTDCRRIAELFRIASEGVSDYVWSQMAEPGQDLLEVGIQRYERENTAFSYQSCTVAEMQDNVVGMLLTFPMHIDKDYIETDPVLAPYSKLEADNSWYVCAIALLPEYRGHGIGTRLMALAEQQCRDNGYRRLSLIAFEPNEGAVRLYRHLGYHEVDRASIVPHPLIHADSGDALLMIKDIEA